MEKVLYKVFGIQFEWYPYLKYKDGHRDGENRICKRLYPFYIKLSCKCHSNEHLRSCL